MFNLSPNLSPKKELAIAPHQRRLEHSCNRSYCTCNIIIYHNMPTTLDNSISVHCLGHFLLYTDICQMCNLKGVHIEIYKP